MASATRTKKQNTFWHSIHNQRRFLEKLGAKLGFRSLQDFITLDHHTLSDHEGYSLSHTYNNNMKELLATTFPEVYWEFQKPKESGSVWSDLSNQKICLERIASLKNIKSLEDWYNVSSSEIIENYNCHFIKSLYGGSLSKCLVKIYPNYKWKVWKFTHVPKSFWNDMNEQRNFFNCYAEENNITTYEQWYSVSSESVDKYGGTHLLSRYYGGSLGAALTTVFPHHSWEIWRFERVPNGFWESRQNRRAFFEQIYKNLEFQSWEEWYTIRIEVLAKYGASYLLNQYYENSPAKALIDLFPELPFKFWCFVRIPDGFWDAPSNQKAFMRWAEEKFQIQKPEDWFQISSQELAEIGGRRLADKYGGIVALLSHFYPSIDWVTGVRQYNSIKTQNWLFRFLVEVFPNVADFQMKYRHPNLVYQDTQGIMELDIFIPELNLAFEYQGKQHYEQIHGMGLNVNEKKSKDQTKRIACEKIGITLIEIPYWWDRTKESLIATIHRARPDIIREPGKGTAINVMPIKR